MQQNIRNGFFMGNKKKAAAEQIQKEAGQKGRDSWQIYQAHNRPSLMVWRASSSSTKLLGLTHVAVMKIKTQFLRPQDGWVALVGSLLMF